LKRKKIKTSGSWNRSSSFSSNNYEWRLRWWIQNTRYKIFYTRKYALYCFIFSKV